METVALDDRGDGKATIFYRNRGWRRVLNERSPDAPAQWVALQYAAEDPVEAADTKMQRFFEHAYRYPETAKPIRRRPRREWERKAGQPVYCPAFGFGEIVAIQGDKIVVKFGKKEQVMAAQDLMTRAQVEADWHLYWLRGERRRLEEGRRLSIIKSLCRHGEWQAFLDKYDYPRSTADDLIRRYREELRWKARTQLTGNRAIQVGVPALPIHERIPDPDDAERKALIKKETEKRRGKEPSHQKAPWPIRINLPPDIIALCRERYKHEGESAREYWRLAAYRFEGLKPPHKKHFKSHRHRGSI